VNFLTDPLDRKATLRLVDVMVYKRVGGKHACVKSTRVSSLVALGVRAFTVGQTCLKAASSKEAKHEKACSDNQHIFIPFAFDTFSFLTSEVVDLLHRVQMIIHNNVMSPRSINIMFMRIDFATKKDLTHNFLPVCFPLV